MSNKIRPEGHSPLEKARDMSLDAPWKLHLLELSTALSPLLDDHLTMNKCDICDREYFWHMDDCTWCPAKRVLAIFLFGWLS